MSSSEIKRLKRENKKLKEANKKQNKKSAGAFTKVNNFQKRVGKDIVPFQRFVYILIFIISLIVGIYFFSAGNNMGGAISLIVGLVILIGGWLWTSAVKNSDSLAKINALQWEIGLVQDIFKK